MGSAALFAVGSRGVQIIGVVLTAPSLNTSSLAAALSGTHSKRAVFAPTANISGVGRHAQPAMGGHYMRIGTLTRKSSEAYTILVPGSAGGPPARPHILVRCGRQVACAPRHFGECQGLTETLCESATGSPAVPARQSADPSTRKDDGRSGKRVLPSFRRSHLRLAEHTFVASALLQPGSDSNA